MISGTIFVETINIISTQSKSWSPSFSAVVVGFIRQKCVSSGVCDCMCAFGGLVWKRRLVSHTVLPATAILKD